MRPSFRFPVLKLLLLVLVFTGACRDDRPGATTDRPATPEGMGGLAPEEFEHEVQPMTPEQAQQLGITDTVPEPPPEGAPEEVPGPPPQP